MALARIKAKLHESKIYPTDGRCKSFMPETSLRKMLNIHDVTQALWDSNFDIPPHKRNDTAETVIREGWKVFAILLELNCEKDLVAFIENDSLDSSLPLDQTILIHIAPDSATKFERLQWEYLPHSFRRSQYHRRLRDAVILPYIRQDEIARGGFSSVYRVLVHSEHQDVVQGTKSEVSHDILGYLFENSLLNRVCVSFAKNYNLIDKIQRRKRNCSFFLVACGIRISLNYWLLTPNTAFRVYCFSRPIVIFTSFFSIQRDQNLLKRISCIFMQCEGCQAD